MANGPYVNLDTYRSIYQIGISVWQNAFTCPRHYSTLPHPSTSGYVLSFVGNPVPSHPRLVSSLMLMNPSNTQVSPCSSPCRMYVRIQTQSRQLKSEVKLPLDKGP
jgi:hypothetical protein